MKKSIILPLLLTLPLLSHAEASCDAYKRLTEDQRHNIRLSVNRGVQEDLGLTLAAIALTESSAGVQRVNMRTHDFGLYAINYKTMKSIAGIQSDLMGAALAFKITYDDEYAARYALDVLKHYRKVHKGDWSKMVSAYNAGNRYWNGAGYLVKVRRNFQLIKQCIL